MKFITLIISLPTENATVRMRAWRALKASGAAVLRDGVYLMPEMAGCRDKLEAVATDVINGGGSAHVLVAEAGEGADYTQLFDRTNDYGVLLADIAQARQTLKEDSVQEVIKQSRKLRKAFTNISLIDFYPGARRAKVESALCELELACAQALSPDEPQPVDGKISPKALADYQGRVWATRKRPWVDRLASAWLIRRFIDPQANFLWLNTIADCPADALGFDFDGASFTHIGNRVTFEVLLASFKLEQPPLNRLAQLVHYLDIGGIAPPEAAGVESILTGLRNTIADDDQLLAAANTLFDGLFSHFASDLPPDQP